MKIAIPAANGRLIAHFGHAPQFAFIEADTENATFTSPVFETAPPHEPGALPRWISEKGADVVITGGMGQRARMLFESAGVDVVTGVSEGPLEEIIQAYLNGALDTSEDACHHDEHHHHHHGGNCAHD